MVQSFLLWMLVGSLPHRLGDSPAAVSSSVFADSLLLKHLNATVQAIDWPMTCTLSVYNAFVNRR